MPREIVVLSPTPPDARVLVEAGAAVDPDLGLRTLYGGAVYQVVRAAVQRAQAELRVHRRSRLDQGARVRRGGAEDDDLTGH